MKTLLLIRHAKSNWSFGELADFERPLSDRGNNDAPKMADRVIKRQPNIDLFMTSSAKRASQTCEHFCKVYGIDIKNVIRNNGLYHASSEKIHEIIKSIDNQFHSAAIFTHNPGVTDFVNGLIDGMRIDNMPTCGVFCVESDIREWSQFEKAEKKLKFFDYPKLD